MTNRFAEAKTWGERAVDLGPQEADARYWYGRALLGGGDEEAAQQQWEAGLQIDMNHPGLLEGLARLALDQQEDAKAYGLLNQMRNLGADDAWIYEMLSDLARRKGLWSTALEHWQDVIARSGENPENLVVAGELAILAGDTATAIAVCEQAVALGGSAEAYGTLGEALFAADRHLEALRALQQAIALDPNQPRYLFNAANILEILGRVDEAEEYFVKYIALAPDDAVGHFNYGIHLDKLDQPRAALEHVTAAISLNPDWLAARIIEAQLLERLGRYEEAIAAIDSVRVRESESPEELLAWRERLEAQLQEIEASELAGQVHLLHIVTTDTLAVRLIAEELAQGTDFAVLATRFSTGPTAAQGGDIGWVAPADMVEPLRDAIEALSLNEISPLVEAKGLYHYFKRIR
jgi:tetratricopeptide (TPR) repeat protein